MFIGKGVIVLIDNQAFYGRYGIIVKYYPETKMWLVAVGGAIRNYYRREFALI